MTDEKQIEYLRLFEERLTENLIKLCTDAGMMGGCPITVDELDAAWHASAAEYMGDAVPNIGEYPLAAIGWACWFGMGAALMWDGKWDGNYNSTDMYDAVRSPRGWDEMDEYVTEELFGEKCGTAKADRLEDMVRSCARAAETAIRKEGVEAQSVMAFHLFARVAKVMYRTGVSIALHGLGYHYERARVELPS